MQLTTQSSGRPVRQLLPPLLRWVIIVGMFALAFGIRFYNLDKPPLDFHPTRQHWSAIIARGYYFESLNSTSDSMRQAAIANKQGQGIVEPRIMELLALAMYRLFGAELLLFPRLLSSVFWLISGAFLYLLTTKLIPEDAALLTTAFYLFLPFGVSASRSFMPDPMMVMMLVISILAIYRYHEQPSRPRLASAAAASAFSILVKPICVFPIFGAFVSLSASRHGMRRGVANASLLAFIAISVLPASLFYSYRTLISADLQEQVQTRFLFNLLLHEFYWRGWIRLIGRVIGYPAFLAALLGVLLYTHRKPRALLLGLWGGYVVFCLIFTYHIHTHDYYHLQLIPIVALSLGSVAELITRSLTQTCTRWYWRAAALGIFALAVLLSSAQVLRGQPADSELEDRVRIAHEVGHVVDHSTETIYLAPYYGKPLQYHGGISGSRWPNSGDFRVLELQTKPNPSVQEWFNQLDPTCEKEFFIVTDFEEFQLQDELRQFLVQNFAILAQSQDYLIFDLRRDAFPPVE